jgi:MFS family permease
VATLGVTLAPGVRTAIACRLLTGAALAGVYPPGMKIAAGWFKEGRGLAIGILVGALTLGSASPHLVRWAVAPEAWRIVLIIAAVSAVAGGLLVLLIPNDGPFAAPSPPFSLAAAPRILKDRAVALANLGYLGHMWEVYAMWTWMAAFVSASEHARRGDHSDVAGLAALVTFAVVGSGAIGCWLGGKYGDRWGRSVVTSVAMLISGTCALAVGLLFGGPLLLLVPLLLVWGVSVVADSAQFSAAVSELAPREYVGTALTLQTSMGFLLTCATIYLLPVVAAKIGWRWSMSLLAIGPALGIWAMLTLRRRSGI